MTVPKTVGFPRLGALGRLGNQLWEAAATIGIAKKMGAKPCLPAHWDYREYFSIPENYFSDDEPEMEANKSPLVQHIDERCRDYLQDYSLFKEIKDEIWLNFQSSGSAFQTLDQKYPWVNQMPRPILSVHVRRGDNVPGQDPGVENKEQYHPLRPFDYYERAIKSLENKYKSMLVFSDDIPWCKQAFAAYDATFFEGGDVRKKEHEVGYTTDPFNDWEDLIVQSWCDHHIIGNSSYAWWGAFLSEDKSPIFSMPWFGPKLSYINAELMIPEGWIRFDF